MNIGGFGAAADELVRWPDKNVMRYNRRVRHFPHDDLFESLSQHLFHIFVDAIKIIGRPAQALGSNVEPFLVTLLIDSLNPADSERR